MVALSALVLAGCAGNGDGEAPAWNHDPSDAALGPSGWGSIDESYEECANGTEQSPVDITGAVEVDLPDLVLDYPETQLTVENTGHTIEVSVPESSNLTLTIDGAEYRLVQFHYHAPSEHTLDGRSYDAEVHFVHESEEGEIAVVVGDGAFVVLPAALDRLHELIGGFPGNDGYENNNRPTQPLNDRRIERARN